MEDLGSSGPSLGSGVQLRFNMGADMLSNSTVKG